MCTFSKCASCCLPSYAWWNSPAKWRHRPGHSLNKYLCIKELYNILKSVVITYYIDHSYFRNSFIDSRTYFHPKICPRLVRVSTLKDLLRQSHPSQKLKWQKYGQSEFVMDDGLPNLHHVCTEFFKENLNLHFGEGKICISNFGLFSFFLLMCC